MDIWLVSKLPSTVENTIELIGLLFVFIIILVAAYFASKFIGQSKLGQVRNKNFQVIETYKVTPNKFLQLVKIGNKYVVIAIGKDEIHEITELSEEEVILSVDSEHPSVKFSDLITRVQKKNATSKDKM